MEWIKMEYRPDLSMPRYDKRVTFMTFDIETTTDSFEGFEQPQAFMYIWQLCIAPIGGRHGWAIYGRTWQAFLDTLNKIKTCYDLIPKYPMRVYVHNLAYEFQFLRSVLDFDKVFATHKRKPLTAKAGSFLFKCSYRLCNMSLSKFLKSENVATQKKTMDYSVARYPDTVLTDDELDYCLSDVMGLWEAIANTIEKQNDTIFTVPFTSTGYVRREAKERVKKDKKEMRRFWDSRLDSDTYALCKCAARGGNTHANYRNAGQILNAVSSRDKASSYPHVMVTKKFPMGAYKQDTPKQGNIGREYAHLITLELYDVVVKPNVTIPYIAQGKCIRIRGVAIDNGRILSAEYISMTICEIDYFIILEQYDIAQIEIISLYSAKKDYLCKEYRDYILEMFRAKCELKGNDEYFYAKFKNKINALFGMMLTDICRSEISYSDDDWHEHFANIDTCLMDYYKGRNSFLSYQHGIYVTAYAREELQKGIDAVGADMVYCDTDSVKYLGDYTRAFDNLNQRIIAESEEAGVKEVTVNGKTYRLGVWESDDYYDEFITWGAKKYAYKHKGEYGCTVAGLSKSKGAEAIASAGGLKNFRIGRVFDTEQAGRMTAIYNDECYLITAFSHGHKVELTSNVALVPTTYTLGITQQYSELLNVDDIYS